MYTIRRMNERSSHILSLCLVTGGDDLTIVKKEKVTMLGSEGERGGTNMNFELKIENQLKP